MPISERIKDHYVSVFRTNLQEATRMVRLRLEPGGSASISFVPTLPANFLAFTSEGTRLYMTTDQFADVHRLLRSDEPVFFTALDLFGLRIGSVHTDLDAVSDDATGADDEDPQSLASLVRQARRLGTDRG